MSDHKESQTHIICLKVHSTDVGKRLDTYLSSKLPRVSRSRISRWAVSKHILVCGQDRKPSYLLRIGDEIQVSPPSPEPIGLVPEDLPLNILHEDSYLLVVDKPAGVVVHPGAGNPRGTLANALAHHLGSLSRKETIRPGIVHRLDKATSGLLVVAKTDWVHDFLSRQFSFRKVKKRYLALVHGSVNMDQGEIRIPLGRHPHSRTRISTQTLKPRQALTFYRVLTRFQEFTYLSVSPHTGRTISLENRHTPEQSKGFKDTFCMHFHWPSLTHIPRNGSPFKLLYPRNLKSFYQL